MPSKQVMSKFRAVSLKSGSGAVVQSPKQAEAIMYSEQRKEKANGGRYPEPAKLSDLMKARKKKR